MPCFQAIVVNDFDPTERLSMHESWEVLTQFHPVFSTLDGAKRFAWTDAVEWQAAQNEDRDPGEDHFNAEIVWREIKPGTWEGTLDDSNIESTDWFARIEECRFLDTEGVAQ